MGAHLLHRLQLFRKFDPFWNSSCLLARACEDSHGDSAKPKGNSMSSPPRLRDRAASDPLPANSEDDPRPRRPPLTERLPGMSDERLVSLQQAATRISLDAEHPKHGSATTALSLIDAEIGRRAAGLAGREPSRPPAGGAVDG
jgi:hypothetical protein